MGESVLLKIRIWNKITEGLPMSIARIRFPGGLNFVIAELKNLKKKGIVDFYETREREIIFYFTKMEPQEVKEFHLNLTAEVPGFYRSEAPLIYLYYSEEQKQFIEPMEITIQH